MSNEYIRTYRRTTVSLDALQDTPIPAYVVEGEDWNGWAIPFLPKESADALIPLMAAIDGTMSYDAEDDVYTVRLTDNPDDGDNDVSQGVDIVVDGQTVHAYPIGAMSWCWTAESEYCSHCRRSVDRDAEVLEFLPDGYILHKHCADELRAEGQLPESESGGL
jgi:hypothetical protein